MFVVRCFGYAVHSLLVAGGCPQDVLTSTVVSSSDARILAVGFNLKKYPTRRQNSFSTVLFEGSFFPKFQRQSFDFTKGKFFFNFFFRKVSLLLKERKISRLIMFSTKKVSFSFG